MRRFLLCVAVGAACVAASGCAVLDQTSDTVEKDFSGTYRVASQSRSDTLQVSQAEIAFDRNGAQLSSATIRLTGASVPAGWTLTKCGDPGPFVSSTFAIADDPSKLEMIVCSNQQPVEDFPVVYLIRSKDGSPIDFTFPALDFSNKRIHADAGRVMVIKWNPVSHSSYALQPG
ncbi:hypothetical protein [Pararobbsia silviterrae]|uniref:Lipoprotein n=1 Tax=Pararobbsia silviterrae TaxID=1792498 RepID=A0A494X6W0_9BURK|nr:hypothetical protein [Pararobbsia silviterrae]RKP46170.1 hypothetical protein D7S86_24935 [Pararobbsia silviterrae]